MVRKKIIRIVIYYFGIYLYRVINLSLTIYFSYNKYLSLNELPCIYICILYITLGIITTYLMDVNVAYFKHVLKSYQSLVIIKLYVDYRMYTKIPLLIVYSNSVNNNTHNNTHLSRKLIQQSTVQKLIFCPILFKLL